MREILFRGKRIDNGEWVYGMPCATEKRGIYAIQMNQGGIFDVVPETIGQKTGLIDKKGNSIYEGDIVSTEGRLNTNIYNEIVKYENGAFSPFAVPGWECTPDVRKCLIRGNIHEDPELLPNYYR